MNLQDQLTSLELSKKLAELGVKAESAFHWYEHEVGEFVLDFGDIIPESHVEEIYPAYSVAELGEMLPNGISSVRPTTPPTNKKWFVQKGRYKRDMIFEVADTEADARAKMLIHLISSGIIEAHKE